MQCLETVCGVVNNMNMNTFIFLLIRLAMDTDNEMFNSEPLHPGIGTKNLTSSCPLNSEFIYGFAILFNWDERIQRPFKLFPRKTFKPDEIKDRCYEHHLLDTFRIKKLKPLKALPGQKISFFAKVEGCKCFNEIYIKLYNFSFNNS